MMDWIVQRDFQILDWIQAHLRCYVLDHFFPAFTSLGEKGILFIIMAVVLFCIPKFRRWGITLAVALLIGLLFGNLIIKNVVARTRPYDLVEYIQLLVMPLSDYSFPSGHTMASFEFVAVTCCMPVRRWCKIAVLVFALIMAFSRLYLYVHFPSDVLGGMTVGTLFGLIAHRIVSYWYSRHLQYVS